MWVWRVLAHAGVAEEPTRAGRAVSGAFAERVSEHSCGRTADLKVCTRVTRADVTELRSIYTSPGVLTPPKNSNDPVRFWRSLPDSCSREGGGAPSCLSTFGERADPYHPRESGHFGQTDRLFVCLSDFGGVDGRSCSSATVCLSFWLTDFGLLAPPCKSWP